jgi:cytochrome b6-f complex iron-sulfur subunit
MAASAVETQSSGSPAPSSSPPAPQRAPKRKKPSGPSRRDFLRNAWLASMLGSLAAFAGASLFMLWPSKRGGFGGIIEVGSVDEVLSEIEAGNGQYPYPAGRMYLVAYDRALDVNGNYLEITQGGEAPVMALYQKCVHLGCRVPWCDSSQWFECPCHGSRYNRWGEYEFGPAPRCLDRFSVLVQDGNIVVDTTNVVTGPARSAGSLDQPPAGPHCN